MKYMSDDNGREVTVSARKLAATLWEINEVPSPELKESLEQKREKMEVRSRERIGKSAKLCSMTTHSSDPSHSPVSERMDRSKVGSHQRKSSVGSQKLLLTDCNSRVLKSLHNASFMETETQTCSRTSNRYKVGVKTRLKDVSDGLTTSKDLLKVLNRIWGLEEQHATGLSLASAIKVELDRAQVQVDKLIEEQRSKHTEIDHLLKRFAEEKASWKTRAQDRIHNAITSVAGELKVEKKLRRQTERLNKKLGKELADTKATLLKAVKDLESEKRAREILEQVCDELARGIGEDRAEVEELKRQSAKVCEDVEKEREMLQLADVLREERVQMKLSEAKYQFEEKNAVVDKLRSELEAYLGTKIGEKNGDGSPNYEKIQELEEYLRKTLLGSCQNGEREKDEGEVLNGEEGGGDDSADSDLHSIELNMDENSKNYEWSYARGGVAQNDSKRISVDNKIKGRKSISEKIQRRSASLERKTSDGIEWEFSTRCQENSDSFDSGRFPELASLGQTKDYEDEIERYKMVKALRDHILSGSRISTSQGFSSPTQKWGQPLTSQDPSRVVCEKLAVLQEAV